MFNSSCTHVFEQYVVTIPNSPAKKKKLSAVAVIAPGPPTGSIPQSKVLTSAERFGPPQQKG